ncbi:TonB-dependent receptor [Acidithiobacillus sulfurivorans]|uniref:TonB-dependent receptor n=1 Tax=Acidithiobacillus sulfurivorans TaxID=1958756 RepID=A0ABS5ZY54_9PROT|nr:TonB-dependent receptor [Acidithiobacillus sulfurivorans]MBU2760147.1 TonB-dependent receptor [Acidithiobacillus sulfurivorans]
MTKAKKQLLRQSILVAVGLLGSSLLPVHAATSATPTKKVYKIKQVSKDLLRMVDKAALTKVKPVYGAETALIPKKFLHGQESTQNASTILSFVPGINATSTNPIGVKTHISVRGFSQTQVGYTFDNLPIADLFNGGLSGGNNNYADLTNLIPVTLGETSGIQVTYGTPPPDVNAVGAIGGNINYLPKVPSSKQYESIFAGYGSFNTRNYGAEINTGAAAGYGNLLLRFSSRQTAGYLEHSPDREYSYYAAYDLPQISPTSKWSLVFLLNKNQGATAARMPKALLDQYGPYYQWPTSFTYANSKAEHMMAILQNKTLISSHAVFGFKGFYAYTNSHRLEYVNPDANSQYNSFVTFYLNPAETVCQSSGNDFMGNDSAACQAQIINGDNYHSYTYTTNTFGLNPSIEWLNHYVNLKAGGLAVVSTYDSRDYVYGTPNVPEVPGYNNLWDEHGWRIYGKVYAQAKIKPTSNLAITPGVKYETISTRINDVPGYYYSVGATSGRTYSAVSPYVGIQYKPMKAITLYANYAKGYKYPNITAFYAADSNATTTSPATPVTIKPESVNTYQFGAAYNKGPVDASISFYRSDFNHTFSSYYDTTNGLTYEYNIGSSQYQGINIATAYALDANLSLYGNYSIQEAEYTSNSSSAYGVSTSIGEARPNTPTYLAGLGVLGHYMGTRARLYGNLVGPQYIEASTGAPTHLSMPAYATMNFNLAHTFMIHQYGIKNVTLSLSGVNLLNSEASVLEKQFPYTNGVSGNYLVAEPMMPRSFFGTVKMVF